MQDAVKLSTDIMLSFACRRESKPGAVKYTLMIDHLNWRAEIEQGYVSQAAVSGHGLKDAERAELAGILDAAQKQAFRHVPEGKIGGLCSIDLRIPSRLQRQSLTVAAPFRHPQFNQLARLWTFILAFHKSRPELAAIAPMLPRANDK